MSYAEIEANLAYPAKNPTPTRHTQGPLSLSLRCCFNTNVPNILKHVTM